MRERERETTVDKEKNRSLFHHKRKQAEELVETDSEK